MQGAFHPALGERFHRRVSPSSAPPCGPYREMRWTHGSCCSPSQARLSSRPTSKSCWSKLVKYDLFNVLNVPSHGRLRGLGIMSLDGSQYPAVAGDRLLRAPFDLQGALTRVAEQVHE